MLINLKLALSKDTDGNIRNQVGFQQYGGLDNWKPSYMLEKNIQNLLSMQSQSPKSKKKKKKFARHKIEAGTDNQNNRTGGQWPPWVREAQRFGNLEDGVSVG